MKKIFLLSALAVGSYLSAQAQHIEFGLHGGYGTTWMFNNNVSDQGDNLDYKASFAPVFGVDGGYFFESRIGVVLGIDYALVQQKYTGEDIIGSFEVTDKLSYIDVPVMLRKCSKSGFYVEIGPKFSFLASAKEDAKHGKASSVDYSGKKVADDFKKTIVSAAFSIGSQFEVGKNLYIDVALRLAYGFTDVTKQYSTDDLALRTLNGKIALADYYAHYDQKNNFSYKNTNLATGYITAGLSYRLPQVKKKAGAPKAE